MFAFQFHIRDYIAKTRHLTLIEDLAYRRLIDAYYTEEAPLPADVQACARLIAMRDHQPEVESVLREFFLLTDGGWTNARCDYEIARYREIGSVRKRAAGLRWGAKQAPDADAMHMHTNCNPEGMPTSQPVNQSTSKPKKPRKPPVQQIGFSYETGEWSGITEAQRKIWADLNPGIDIDSELKEAAGWLLGNPDKPRSHFGQFLNKWFSPKKGNSRTVPLSGAAHVSSNPFEGLA